MVPALSFAMATACFSGYPEALNSLIFALITFFDLPGFKGQSKSPNIRVRKQQCKLLY
jgi:hypothetical protein